MKVNDFLKEFTDFVNSNQYTKKAINRYETGYITYNECIDIIVDEYKERNFVYQIMYKKAGKGGKYKPLDDILYNHNEASEMITELKMKRPDLSFRTLKQFAF